MGDYARWCNYCNFMVNTSEGNVSLLGEILWKDESTFTRVGIVKDHNVHYWSDHNVHYWSLAHIPRTVWHQIHWSINVWCGTWGIQIVGPICYNGNLKIDCYLPLLAVVVSAFWGPYVKSFKCLFVSNRRIRSTDRCIWWSCRVAKRSPDLTLMDFYL